MPIRTSLLFLELTVFDLEVMLRRELCFQQGAIHFVQDDTLLVYTSKWFCPRAMLVNFHELCSLTSSSYAR